MMAKAISRKPFSAGAKTTVICSLIAVALACAPATFSQSLRQIVHDGLRPGHALIAMCDNQASCLVGLVTTDTTPIDRSETVSHRSLEWELRRRDIEIRRLQQRIVDLSRHGASPWPIETSASLIVPLLIEARVIATEQSTGGSPQLVIDRGGRHDLARLAMVVETAFEQRTPTIDQGESTSVVAGQPVYAGRCILGRIAKAGQWTSTVVPITSTHYSGRAQLARRGTQGTVFGAEGILRGDDQGMCILTGISVTERVSVGDDVYSGGQSAGLLQPMYYGRVAEASLTADSQWYIRIRPAARLADAQTVAVLRETINPIRILGQ